jgi:hypothetical protein
MTFGLSAAAIGGIAAGAGAIGGAIISSKGAKSAANTQAQAEQNANATNKEMFDEQLALQAPFRENGLAANNRLAFLLGLTPSPTAQSASPSPFGALPQVPNMPLLDQRIPGFHAATQILSQGSDGVFSPPQAESADAIRARLAGQFTTNTGTHKETFSIHGDNGDTTELRDVPNGPTVNQAALDAAVQQEVQRQQQAAQQAGRQQQAPATNVAGTPSAPAANNLDGFGSLAHSFSQADYAADGAPKFAAFNQAVPGAPQLGAFQDNTNLAQFQDSTNLAQFQDMPAFKPDMLKDDPGYQFRLEQGTKGLASQYAGKGSFFSGAAMKGIDQYNQDYASGEYGNAFNRYQTQRGNNLQDYLTNQNTQQANRSNALQDYTTNIGTQQANRANALQDYQTNLGTQQQNFQNQNTAYNTGLNQYSLNRANALQDYQTAYDRFQTNRANVINPLLSLSGAGQQATNQQSNAAQNFGAQSTAAITGAGNAIAAGQVGSANAIGGAFGSAANNFQQNQLMNLLLSRNGGGSSFAPSTFANSPMSSSILYSNGSLGD